MNHRIITLIVLTVLASGCATAPVQDLKLPQTVQERSDAEVVAPKLAALDPQAEAFVQKALERSPDLAQVEARWREVAALARVSEGALHPRVEASVQASAGVDRVKSTGDSATARQRVKAQQVGLDFRWELDLFGRLSSVRQAADHERLAAKADLDAARVTLANLLRSEVVRLRSAHRALTVAETLLDDLRETVLIESSARSAGLRSDIDLSQLRSSIAAREADLSALRLEHGAVRLRLRTLSDLPLGEIDGLQGDSVRCVVEAPIEQVPLRWLRERRDVAAAEARLQASSAQAHSAHAALYPLIGLTGTLGRLREAGTQFATIVSQSLQRSLMLGLVGTLFDGGQRAADARAADARTAAAMAVFQRTLLQAAEEVDGAIDRLQVIGVAREASEAAASESRLALARTERRLAAGIDSRLTLLQIRREAGEHQFLALGFERDYCIAGFDLNRALGLREVP